jgi:hypothetical protein
LCGCVRGCVCVCVCVLARAHAYVHTKRQVAMRAQEKIRHIYMQTGAARVLILRIYRLLLVYETLSL